MEGPNPWHRLFGLSFIDFFQDVPGVEIEMEVDLSLKQQFLDVVILRKDAGVLPRRMPDGFEELAAHNLISFKSHQESLDGWAVNEFIGHYVNYRKQASPNMRDLLPESDFRLFAVTVRHPKGLAGAVDLQKINEGVYEIRHFTGKMRLIVVHELPQNEHNAQMHLFSAKPDLWLYGAEHYRQHSKETSTLLNKLVDFLREEGDPMSLELLKQFARETRAEVIRESTFAERLEGIPAEERVKGLPPEERVKGLPPEERVKGLPPEERVKGLTIQELLAALSPEKKRDLMDLLKKSTES